MRAKQVLLPCLYSLSAIALTFLVGQLILWFFHDNTNVWASILFILMNLIPMSTAFVFVRISGEIAGTWQMIKAAFTFHEKWYTYLAAAAVPLVYYGVSILLGNVTFTGAPFAALLVQFPWTLLQGGLEEVGWRWYLQSHLCTKKSLPRFLLSMLLISFIWFLWHIPIYRLPWITGGSSNSLIFYFMILGNTFALGAVKELSRSSVPCVATHMLINTMAVSMLVGSNLKEVILLAGVEILLSIVTVVVLFHKHTQRLFR